MRRWLLPLIFSGAGFVLAIVQLCWIGWSKLTFVHPIADLFFFPAIGLCVGVAAIPLSFLVGRSES